MYDPQPTPPTELAEVVPLHPKRGTYRTQVNGARNNTGNLEWLNQAACADANPEWFFEGDSRSRHKAKRLCHDCPVAGHCLTEALDDPKMVGTWGGTSVPQRKKIRRGETITTRCLNCNKHIKWNRQRDRGGLPAWCLACDFNDNR